MYILELKLMIVRYLHINTGQ